ncbi:ABC transporter ATP-binding protein [Pseudotabrizicola sp. 4114]|uniref:ABC transporter ATP-binding protein n=1 Tax=Pseudotabrizicola sp. 4114 TaxID=2817731 RepID=UPI00286181B4|nr:peptide/nickel transport system ATP-binding protein [Pseudorhodobacter sp. 4114]
MSDRHKVLDIKQLDLSLRTGQKILSGIDLSIGYGRILGVIGESGAGKSMIGTAIADTLPHALKITKGNIEFEGLELTAMSSKIRRALLGRDIGFIPQEPMTALNPSLTIGQQIGDHLKRIGFDTRKDRIDKAVALFEEVGLQRPKELLDCYPHQLSGGMLQRVLIAMAFASNPKLVVADEPTTALDVTIQARVVQLISRMREIHNTSVLFITHDLELAADVCDDVVVLYGGQIVETGAAQTILRTPRHPYSRCLKLASPKMEGPRGRLMILPDTMPSAQQREAISGCYFTGRCPLAQEVCARHRPPLATLDAGHQTACHFPERTNEINVSEAKAQSAATTVGEEVVLRAAGLGKTYVQKDWLGRSSHVEALKDVNFEVRAGEFVGIVGESGSGKSTLTKLIVGLEGVTAGRLEVVGLNRAAATPEERKALIAQVQLIFQDPQSALNPRRKVASLVVQPLEARPERPTKAETTSLAAAVLTKVMLPADAGNRFPDQLSGGQKQRVNIARALSSNPRLLIADEIVSGLDVSVQAQILELLQALRAEGGFSLLLVSHDLAVVRHICDRAIVMYRGSIVEQGPVDAVFGNPQHPYTKTLVAAAKGNILD